MKQRLRQYTAAISASPIAGSTLALGGLTMCAKVLGFTEKLVLANYFGAGSLVDSYFAVIGLFVLLFLFVREVVEPAFIPTFIGALEKGQRETCVGLFQVVALGTTLCVAPLCLLAVFQPVMIVHVILPGFSDSQVQLSASMLPFAAAGGLALALSALTYAVLNATRNFAIPATGDLAQKLVLIGACVVAGNSGSASLALAIGFSISGFARLATHLRGLPSWLRVIHGGGRAGIPESKQMASLMAPLVLGSFVAQLSVVADNYFASKLGSGAISNVGYARKLADLPVLLLAQSLGIVAFPFLSSIAHEPKRFATLLVSGLRVLAVVMIPIAVVTSVTADSLVSLAFERGAFGSSDRIATATILRAYAIGMPVFAIEVLIVAAFFARKDTRKPVIVGIAAVCLDVVLLALLVPCLGAIGVAVALVVSKTAKVFSLGYILIRSHAGAASTALKEALLWGTAALASVTVVHFLVVNPDPGSQSLTSQVKHVSTATACVFFVFCVFAATFSEPIRTVCRRAIERTGRQ